MNIDKGMKGGYDLHKSSFVLRMENWFIDLHKTTWKEEQEASTL